jgi:hypothetical protein
MQRMGARKKCTSGLPGSSKDSPDGPRKGGGRKLREGGRAHKIRGCEPLEEWVAQQVWTQKAKKGGVPGPPLCVATAPEKDPTKQAPTVAAALTRPHASHLPPPTPLMLE